jgi:polyisoprenoid-binding protein YceI
MKRLTLLAGVVAAIVSTALSASAADYVFDIKGQHASIGFRVKHLGYSWLTGRFDKFDGTFSYDPANPAASKVSVEIDTASISSNHAERDKHLRGPDYLDSEAYPKATFVSTEVIPEGDNKAKIKGNFTLRGVTKEVVLDMERMGGGPAPWGGQRMGFTGTAKLTIADFGFKKQLGPASTTAELFLDVEGVQK